MPNRFIENPTYRKQQVPGYRGNPLIEALPDIMKSNERGKVLGWSPELPDKDTLALPNEERMHCVAFLIQLAIVLPEYASFEPVISIGLRQGYIGRNPCSPDVWREVWRNNQAGEIRRPSPSSINVVQGMLFSGISGMGKSTFLERCLSGYPQVIQHTQYEGKPFRHTQLVYLKVNCPSNASGKTLSKAFFRSVDDVLGTDYFKRALTSRATGYDMQQEMALIAQNHWLGILFLDELEQLIPAPGRSEENLLDDMASLFNAIKVPVGSAGTPKVISLFEKKLSNVRRISGSGLHMFEPSATADDPSWIRFMEELWKYTWLRGGQKLTLSIRNAYFKASGGVTFFAVAIHMFCQYRILSEAQDVEKITVSCVQSVAATELAPAAGAIRALLSGQDATSRYEDLLPDLAHIKRALSMPPRPAPAPPRSRGTKPPGQTPPPDPSSSESETSGHQRMKDQGLIPDNPGEFSG